MRWVGIVIAKGQNRIEQERDHMESLGIDGKTLLT